MSEDRELYNAIAHYRNLAIVREILFVYPHAECTADYAMPLNYFDKHIADDLSTFADFISFPSVSANHDNLPDCQRCAAFLARHLSKLFTVEQWEKPGHPPVLFASYTHADRSKPTLLLYNHYDVQPADVSEGWLGDPFVMRVCQGRCYARGVSDNKGQCFYTWKALEYYFHKHEEFPINIRWIIEGEEESGSSALHALASEQAQRLRADHLLIIDGGFVSEVFPCVSIGARGILSMKVRLTEGNSDMHSGIFGGIAYNVNRALAEVLSSLHDSDNRIAVEHFYDMIEPVACESFPLHLEFEPTPYPPARTPQEATRCFPTLEINGISGGYTGPGFKTIIPHQATAYLSCRLVPRQDPIQVGQLVLDHIRNRVPKSLIFSGEILNASPGWRASTQLASMLQPIYAQLYGFPCREITMEGSIPIAPFLAQISRTQPTLCGVSYLSDRIHSVEENFSIDQLRKGFLSIYFLLNAIRNSGRQFS